eukprot:scaffold239603_cov30-Tisochrysis_lutea.AAC.8
MAISSGGKSSNAVKFGLMGPFVFVLFYDGVEGRTRSFTRLLLRRLSHGARPQHPHEWAADQDCTYYCGATPGRMHICCRGARAQVCACPLSCRSLLRLCYHPIHAAPATIDCARCAQ